MNGGSSDWIIWAVCSTKSKRPATIPATMITTGQRCCGERTSDQIKMIRLRMVSPRV